MYHKSKLIKLSNEMKKMLDLSVAQRAVEHTFEAYNLTFNQVMNIHFMQRIQKSILSF